MSNFDLIAVERVAQIRANLSCNNTEGVDAIISKLRGSLDDEHLKR